MSEKTTKGDFVEIKFTGKANNEIFDSNIEEDLKKINPEAKPQQLIVVIGENMLVPGLDHALEDKEIGKEYDIKVVMKDGFGPRKRELLKTIPLKMFTEQKIMPRAGMVLALDNMPVRIAAVSGARVIADFNNPLSGKDLEYKLTITRKITDDVEKTQSLFTYFLRINPKVESTEKEIKIFGNKKVIPVFKIFQERFEPLLGKKIVFEETEDKEEKTEKHDSHSDDHSHDHSHEHEHEHSHEDHEHPHTHAH